MGAASPTFLDTLEIGGKGALGAESAWTNIGGIKTSTPTFGDKWATQDGTAFGDAVRQNYKTIRDPDLIQLVMNRIFDDAGQNALKAAAADAAAGGYDYNFRAKFKDGGGTVLETYTFKARVMTFQGGSTNPTSLHDWRADIEVVSAYTVA